MNSRVDNEYDLTSLDLPITELRSSAAVNKIGPNTPNTQTDTQSARNAVVTQFRGDRRSAASNDTGGYADTVALSSTAVDLNALESRIKQLPDVDAAKVVDLAARIAQGEYQVDAERVADKMLDFESQL